ncbi:P-loop containing nucleoside triphosphate hydrolase protein [Geopyxis carbonaria]|nr:P-loop containing nucleoside triphosphate hydrolase protein [Geopyxis carbonaria]
MTWRYSDDEPEKDGNEEKTALPVYLQDKKEALLNARKALENGLEEGGMAGVFRVPPSWDDIDFSDDERIEELESRPKFDAAPCAPYEDIYMEESLGYIPCSIAQYLRTYQIEGVKFLHKNFVFQKGCILGDDMGLGKTVQVISFLAAAFGKTGDERDAKRMRKMRQWRRRHHGEERWYPKVLIICPSSLISNWEDEFARWGWWNVYAYHGTKAEKENALSAAKADSLEVMITNYETYRLRHADVNMVHWDCVVADECHKIKERSSETTQRMNEINALCRIGLTGTAIQNKYEELWTLLNWCRPGSIGSLKEWERKIAKPLLVGQTHNAKLAQIGRARRIATMLVNNLLPRMFLRRMKTLIAHQLPTKTDKVVFCPLTDTQREAYEAYLDSDAIRMIRDGNDACDCGSGKRRRKCCHGTDAQGRKHNELVFPAIMWVQKLSNHLANWIPSAEDSSDARAHKLELLQTCLPDRWRELVTRERLYNYMDPQMCGKWLVLQKLLAFWHAQGDKVLIFSYSINLLHILLELFKQTAYNVCYLDGSMPLHERARAVAAFNADPLQFVFLISTKAGGVGLNITAANKVVIFDPNWNPAYDLQAQDRAYRIGQTRNVEVFRLISAGTIEEIVYARQIYKQQQANIGYGASEERRYFTGVMGDSTNQGELFGLRNMFSFQDNTILQAIVNKTNVAERRAGVLVVQLDAADAAADAPLADDYDDDDGRHALSQLASIALADGAESASAKAAPAPPQPNPIAAILSSAGVSYTHENSEVIGTSAVEARISARARATMTTDVAAGEQQAFDDSGDEGDGGEGGVVYRFKPPEEVRRRQFCEAARVLGFGGVREFALVVESWTQEQRRVALERFYRGRIEELAGGGKGVGQEVGREGEGEVKVDEKVQVKEERKTEETWTGMADTTIEISDDDDEL